MKTKVLNLATGYEEVYTCSPEVAVKSAYCREHNLITQFAVTLGEIGLPLVYGKHTVSCGDFTALLK